VVTRRSRRASEFVIVALLAVLGAVGSSCGGGALTMTSSGPPGPLAMTLSASSITAAQDGTPASVTVTITRPAGNSASITLTATSVPSGVTDQITNPGMGNTGSITFTPQTAGSPGSGTYLVTLNATDGTNYTHASLSLVIAIVASVASSVDTSAGKDGVLNAFMSTSFQPAEWDDSFFTSNPQATTTLGNLNSQHIRLQPVSQGTPQASDMSWSFAVIDSIVNPVISVADHSPELQLAQAPGWMDDSNGDIETSHFADFAAYAADMVEYYNTAAGFTDSTGVSHVHSATQVTPIQWWGIFNEPNINGLSASDYTTLYNLVVPAMQAANSDVTIKFVAVELADYSGQPQMYMPTFVAGVTAQADAVATHFYSSCNQMDSDQTVMSTVPGFASDVQYIYSEMATNPSLADLPVWVTENNVNADYANANGYSTCNPGQIFVPDQRGTSAFFAAWRPYVFSQLVKAGAQALYHWDFDADQQYGEVDYNTGQTYLSYWVDYWLQRYFPACPVGVDCANTSTDAPETILNLSTTDSSSVESLAARNPQGWVTVMIADHAVANASDNNGAGSPRTVIVDLSALGAFSSGTQLTIDATTSATQGPSATSITPAPRVSVVLQGYGVTFLQLKP